ncbi:hypothetical protein BC826DRAFT_1048469, partial [Russula brevipes]
MHVAGKLSRCLFFVPCICPRRAVILFCALFSYLSPPLAPLCLFFHVISHSRPPLATHSSDHYYHHTHSLVSCCILQYPSQYL